MRSVWLCSRNDAIGNLAVMGAAVLVNLTSSAWPDVLVALVMGTLALVAARSIVAQARIEISGAGQGIANSGGRAGEPWK